MSDQSPNPPANPEPYQAAPGPHPHEADDVRFWRGDSTEVPTEAAEQDPETTETATTAPETAPPAPEGDQSGANLNTPT